ncbi:hypothetical protein ACFXJ6_03530 [Streptomyces sp. NPDC059218]|uniref:hypothetical protein n=1 Tax=unclassified Streptomyces TaxID=2593676 RepID=UPI0036CF4204
MSIRKRRTIAWHGPCLTARRDELLEPTNALLCANGLVRSPVELTLLAERRRGHGALYDDLNRGGIDVGRLRRTLGALPQPGRPAVGSSWPYSFVAALETGRTGVLQHPLLHRCQLLPHEPLPGRPREVWVPQ